MFFNQFPVGLLKICNLNLMHLGKTVLTAIFSAILHFLKQGNESQKLLIFAWKHKILKLESPPVMLVSFQAGVCSLRWK